MDNSLDIILACGKTRLLRKMGSSSQPCLLLSSFLITSLEALATTSSSSLAVRVGEEENSMEAEFFSVTSLWALWKMSVFGWAKVLCWAAVMIDVHKMLLHSISESSFPLLSSLPGLEQLRMYFLSLPVDGRRLRGRARVPSACPFRSVQTFLAIPFCFKTNK